MKGRARSADSVYAVVCETKNVDKVTQEIQHYKKVDATLKNYLITRTIDREIPDVSRTVEQFSEVIKPFVTPSGAILQAESTLMLMYRYCQTLPHDAFTQSTGIWTIISKELGNFKVSLQLPMQSTVKDIIYVGV